jgi:putative nucleotidyltransferase with HDIG domain
MIDRLKKLTSVQVWLLSIVISLVMTECIVGGMGILLAGKVTYDYLLMGFVASLFVAGLVGGFLTFSLTKQRKAEAHLRNVDTKLKARVDIDITDTTVKADTGKRPDGITAPLHISKPRVIEQQVVPSYIKKAVSNLDTLPAMPVIAQKLLALKLDTEEGERMLLTLIEQDPQISAKILGMANSAMLGASRQIKSVRDAAMLLGVKRVQSIAVGIAIISLMTVAPAGEFRIQDLWLHSFRVAFAMQGIARAMPAEMRPQDDQIFLVGLLHDIGYLALAFLEPKLSNKLHNYLAAEPQRPSLEVEREILEICHDELGAELARHWNLPEEIIAVLRYHHSPDAAEASAGQPLVRMINLVEKLLPSYGIIEYVTPDISLAEWEALGIDPSKAEEVKEQVNEQAEQAIQFASSFNR